MNNELQGTLLIIHETQTFPSGFTKREFVVKTDDKYPQEIKLEAVKDDCVRLDAYQTGDPITVSFNVRGNEHNGKHYVNLQAWKFDRSEAPSRPVQKSLPPAPTSAMDDSLDDDDSDIPF